MSRSGLMSGFRVKANSSIRSLLLHKIAVCFRPAISEKLPHIADFLDLIEIQIRDDNLFLTARSFGDDLAARGAKITLAIKFSDVPWILAPDAIYRADEVAVSDGMGRLLQFPKIFAQTRNCR